MLSRIIEWNIFSEMSTSKTISPFFIKNFDGCVLITFPFMYYITFSLKIFAENDADSLF